MTAALENWHQTFADLPLFGDGAFANNTGLRSDNLDVFQTDVAYHVTLGRAVVVKSDYAGDIQIEVDYALEGFRPKKVWYTLPMQESDIRREAEQVTWITQKRMRDISLLYAAAIPSMFALYDVVHTDGPDKRFVGVDGRVMDNEAFGARRKVLEGNLVEAVKALHEKLGQPVRELEGTKLFMVICKNLKKPKYPFVNIYRQAPYKYPLWRPCEYPMTTEQDDAQVPF